LIDADLRNADLRNASLINAYMQKANLSGANLSGARLHGASLHGANLSNAELTGASLLDVYLVEANLKGANLSSALLMNSVFADVDLTGAVGLETCLHIGPSIVDHRTLQRSGPLPLSFLRGVGLPDELIKLFNQTIQYFSCFISYSAKDQDDDFAKRIHADLQNNGVRCWFAPHDLPIGGKIRDAIDKEIKLRDKLLLILSKNSIESKWVADEVDEAFEEEQRRDQVVLFPVRLDDEVLTTDKAWASKLRRAWNIGDFRNWKDHDAYQESLARVLRDLTKPTEPVVP
jgi:hypothetical protein